MSPAVPVTELAHLLGILPVLWLIGLRERRKRYWIMALAFGVSWLADTAAHWVDPNVVGNFYPFLQSGLVVAAVMDEDKGRAFIAVVGLVAVVLIYHDAPIDVILRTVAWGGASAVIWPHRELGLLRWSLLTAFGLGLLAWWGYAWDPSWTTWGIYQWTRVAATALFCLSAVRIDHSCGSPTPSSS